jgi:hypothetical protein
MKITNIKMEEKAFSHTHTKKKKSIISLVHTTYRFKGIPEFSRSGNNGSRIIIIGDTTSNLLGTLFQQ